MPATPPAIALGQRFRPHIEDLRAIIYGVVLLRGPIAPLLMLVWHRLHRTLVRLDRLAARWQRGRHLPRPGKPGTPRAGRTPSETPVWRIGLPTRTPQGHAWLIRLHQPMAQLAPRIQLMLDDPEIQALCAAAPQAGRLLRPLCRMFGLPLPENLRLPPAPRKPRPKTPRKPKPTPFAEHSPAQWPFVPRHLRLRVPGLPRGRPGG